MQYGSACDALFTPLKNVIDMLRLAGVVTVAASGNDGIETLIDAPACISTVVAIGSTDKEDHISDFSSMSQQVGLVAPGGFTFGEASCEVGEDNVNILSSISNPEANDEYDCLAGTSMAAPHVAGAFAAIRTVCPDATIDRISAALQTTGVKISYMTSTATQTASRISVDLARQTLGCASHDFNGDGKSDILFRDSLGDTAVWLMNGAPDHVVDCSDRRLQRRWPERPALARHGRQCIHLVHGAHERPVGRVDDDGHRQHPDDVDDPKRQRVLTPPIESLADIAKAGWRQAAPAAARYGGANTLGLDPACAGPFGDGAT